MAGARVVDILATLSAAGPAASWPDHLVEECRQATGMTGVGLAVVSAEGVSGVVAATGGPAQRMEDLQFTLGEGPCADASTSRRPVLCSDLGVEGVVRWPAFASGAAQAGIAAAFTFPLQVGAVAIGVLDLYRDRRGPLSGAHLTEAVAFADAAVAVLLHLQERRGDDPVTGVDVDPGWADLVDRRAVVHQAAGMISVQLDVGVVEALLRLRATAFARDLRMADLAGDVVARRVRFDDSEIGLSPGPGGPDVDGSPEEEST
jgi:GAF domain-containing protein